MKRKSIKLKHAARSSFKSARAKMHALKERERKRQEQKLEAEMLEFRYRLDRGCLTLADFKRLLVLAYDDYDMNAEDICRNIDKLLEGPP